MDKAEFVSKVAEKAGISTAEAERAVDALFDADAGADPDTAQGPRKVAIPGFGTFIQQVKSPPALFGDAPVVKRVAVKLASGERFVVVNREAKARRRILGMWNAVRASESLDPEVPSERSEPMSQSHSASIGEIRDLAISVWENPQDAEEFLTTPHALLDGETPWEVARTARGAERVREILLALEYGLPV